MSAMLRSAARRIEPPRQRRRWPFLTAGLVIAASAATAAAAAISKRGPGTPGRPGEDQADEPTAQSEQATSSADVNGRVHTP